VRPLTLLLVLAVAWPPGAADAAGPDREARGARPRWMRRLDRLASGHPIGIAVRTPSGATYRWRPGVRRTPASNQKLLLSMALMDFLGPHRRLETEALAPRVRSGGVIRANLWLVGHGDPLVDRGTLRALARRLVSAGITRVRGSVRGSTRGFARDWFAPGWKPYFPRELCALPTALTFEGNAEGGRHIRDPERRAATFLTQALERRGVAVAGRPGAGRHPSGLRRVARIRSLELDRMLSLMNRDSRNSVAEVLGKLHGALRIGSPGTIAKGATALRRWAGRHGATVVARDASGLSYRNRASPAGIVRLLQFVGRRPWWDELRDGLATGGQGTLEDRLRRVPVRAKTGTLTEISALSGWVRLRATRRWASFSILSSGMPKSRASAIEDAVVRTLWRHAR
jgi:serine-type D-Ala-D-Ala carboxypeptidase/endopeptidase (penicillin-binding protein 4)